MHELSKESNEMRIKGAVPVVYFAWKLLGVSDIEVKKEQGFSERITGQVSSRQ